MEMRLFLYGLLLLCVKSIHGRPSDRRNLKNHKIVKDTKAGISIPNRDESRDNAFKLNQFKGHMTYPSRQPSQVNVNREPLDRASNRGIKSGRLDRKRNKKQNNLHSRSTKGTEVSTGIQKRGWSSIVVYGGSMLIRTTSYGLTIASLVTGGCSYYPSICEDKDAIEALDKEITQKKADFDDLYYKSADNWVNLRDANNNNGYINFYINESMQSLTTLTQYQQDLDKHLQKQLPALYDMYQNQTDLSSEDYLQALIGQLDVSLKQINVMLQKQWNSEMIGLVTQFVVENTLDQFIRSYTEIFSDYRLKDLMEIHMEALHLSLTLLETDPEQARILMDPDDPRYNEVLESHGLKSSEITSFDLYDLSCRTLSEMYENAGYYIQDKMVSVSEWGEISTLDEFKEKSYRALEGPIDMYHATKEFVFNEESRKYTIENFELTWSSTITTTIGAIADVIMTVADAEQWKEVAKNMEAARLEYETFLAELNNEMSDLEDEQADQEAEWVNVIDTFKNLSGSFQNIIDDANANAEFADVLGLPRSPIESSNPLLSVDMDSLNKDNIIETQIIYIDFLVDNNNDLAEINDEFYSRDILYSEVTDSTVQGNTIDEIENQLKEVYKYGRSNTVVDFGAELSTKNIVCTCAVLRVDLNEYDHYDLVPFRPVCNVSDSDFQDMDAEAEHARNGAIMDTIVYDEVSGGGTPSLESILLSVQEAYSTNEDADMQIYGKSLTEQDIACSIATQFPTMDMYLGIDLTRFRPDCSAVSENDFTDMQTEAERIRNLDSDIAGVLQVCDDFSYCPCIPELATKYGVTETEVKNSMIRVDPTRMKYCGTGCTCVYFS